MRLMLLAMLMVGCHEDDPSGFHRPSSEVEEVVEMTAPRPGECNTNLSDDQLGTNVMFILIDDVGNDKIGAYEEHPDPATTPTINALASEGVLFRNAYSHPGCSPTRAAVLTGRYPERTGVGAVLTYARNDWELQPEEVTIPEMLWSSPFSWSDAAIGKWHLITQPTPDKETHPNTSGFDWFQGTLVNIDTEIQNDPTPNDFYHWEKVENGVSGHSDVYNTTDIVDDALERIPQLEEPWFLYLPIHAAHGPWHAPPAELIAGEVDESSPNIVKWTASLEAADTEIARLLAGVDPEVLARTTVAIMGDNGTKGTWITAPWTSGRGKLTMFESGINVPLIVTGPLVAEPGSESAALVHAVDVLPTIAEIACVNLNELTHDDGSSVAIDGESLVPFLLDPDAEGREFVYNEALAPPGFPNHTARSEHVLRNQQFKLLTNELTGNDHLYEFVPGEYEEGPDLLAGVLTPEQQDAYDLLKDEMASFRANLVFDYP